MSSFVDRALKASRAKAKKTKEKIVKTGLKLAKAYTPVDTKLLQSTVREVEESDYVSYIVWGNEKTLREMKNGGQVGYENFVAFGTVNQSAQLFHVATARALAKEFKDLKMGSGISAGVSATTGKITIPKNRQLVVI